MARRMELWCLCQPNAVLRYVLCVLRSKQIKRFLRRFQNFTSIKKFDEAAPTDDPFKEWGLIAIQSSCTKMLQS